MTTKSTDIRCQICSAIIEEIGNVLTNFNPSGISESSTLQSLGLNNCITIDLSYRLDGRFGILTILSQRDTIDEIITQIIKLTK